MALPVPVPDPFFWWTLFSRFIRQLGSFSTKFGATRGAKYNHTHHLSQRKPSVTRSYQVLPTSYHFPPRKKIALTWEAWSHWHAATLLGSTKLSRFVQTSGSLVRKAPQLLPRTHGRHAREPGQRVRCSVHRCENHGWLLDQTKMNKTPKLLRIHWMFG